MSEEVAAPVEVVDPVAPIEQSTDIIPDSLPEQFKIVGDGGEFTKEFLDSLPDELGAHSSFKKYKTLPDYIKGAVNQSKLQGKRVEEFLASEEPEAIELRHKALGIPKEVSEYEYKPVEGFDALPEDMQAVANENYEASKEFMQSIGISKAQFEKLVEFDMTRTIDMVNQGKEFQEKQKIDAENELRGFWKGDAYDEGIRKTKKLLEAVGLEELSEDPAIGNNPKIIKLLHDRLSSLVDDDKIIEAKIFDDAKTNMENYEDVMQKMREYKGNESDPEYRKMMEKAKFYLNKSK